VNRFVADLKPSLMKGSSTRYSSSSLLRTRRHGVCCELRAASEMWVRDARARPGAAAQAGGARPADRQHRARDSAIRWRRSATPRSCSRGEAQRDLGRLTRIIHDNTRASSGWCRCPAAQPPDRISAERISLAPWLAGFIVEFAANEALPAERLALEATRARPGSSSTASTAPGVWNLLKNAVRHARAEPRAVRLVIGAYADRID